MNCVITATTLSYDVMATRASYYHGLTAFYIHDTAVRGGVHYHAGQGLSLSAHL